MVGGNGVGVRVGSGVSVADGRGIASDGVLAGLTVQAASNEKMTTRGKQKRIQIGCITSILG
jgi:hypothetical protein